jgi:hypothetical protein
MTLTFLILAGQVKVKGQLGEMAKCLEDDDKKIADLARMFFTELATKDNAVYNHFVDMFSLLSAERNLEEASLRRIVKFLIGFVEKVSRISNTRTYGILFSHSFTRKNTLVNSPINWPLVSLAARPNASGTMLPMRCPCSRIRTRRLPNSSLLASTRWSAGQPRLLPARQPAHPPARRRSAHQHNRLALLPGVDDVLMVLMTVFPVYIRSPLGTWLGGVGGWLVGAEHCCHLWSFNSYLNIDLHFNML